MMHAVVFAVTFRRKGTAPIPVTRQLCGEGVRIEFRQEQGQLRITFGTPEGSWKSEIPGSFSRGVDADDDRMMDLPFLAVHYLKLTDNGVGGPKVIPLGSSRPATDEELDRIRRLALRFSGLGHYGHGRPYASAPVRSKPRRTYDPARTAKDPEGDYVPMYLAREYFQHKGRWTSLKERLEDFGQDAGLFDEISIKPLGRRESEPFQVQVRKFADRLKGPPRNLIDVGYGVSQVLPVITELLRDDAPPMFLLQQPEVHLHPSAQAALGSLFCQVARPIRQLVVETHSDHLLDRVRMDIRDGKTELKPDDVSILFFERGALDVRIHSLRLDKDGNVLDAPQSYRRFFMEETTRSLGL